VTATRTTLALPAAVTAMSSGDSFITSGLPSQRRAKGSCQRLTRVGITMEAASKVLERDRLTPAMSGEC
jgi:hypothetical protein